MTYNVYHGRKITTQQQQQPLRLYKKMFNQQGYDCGISITDAHNANTVRYGACTVKPVAPRAPIICLWFNGDHDNEFWGLTSYCTMHGPHNVFDIGHYTVIHCDAEGVSLVDQ